MKVSFSQALHFVLDMWEDVIFQAEPQSVYIICKRIREGPQCMFMTPFQIAVAVLRKMSLKWSEWVYSGPCSLCIAFQYSKSISNLGLKKKKKGRNLWQDEDTAS